MPIPTALVSVTIKSVSNLDPTAILGARSVYALAVIAGRRIGRSRPFPPGALDFTFDSEPLPWTHEIAAAGESIPIDLQIWDERGDDAPSMLASVLGRVTTPYRAETLRFGSSPACECEVVVRLVPPPQPSVPVPRAASGTTTQSTLRLTDTIVVEMTSIEGLYAPLNSGISGLLRAEIRSGYTSEDDMGRVYLNTELDGQWHASTQLIRLSVQLTVARGTLPVDTKVKWTVTPMGDPTNDDPGFHAEWGRYVDPDDYDSAGHKGAHAHTFEGKLDRSPPWEADPGFAIVAIRSDSEAVTDVVGGESRVILHCPNTAGERFAVHAEVEASTPVESFGATTGIITMWHRVRVAYFKMDSAFDVPVADIPRLLEPACVELDFEMPRPIPDISPMAMDPGSDDLEINSAACIESHFDVKVNPGWFVLVAAMVSVPDDPQLVEVVHEGPVALGVGNPTQLAAEFIDIPTPSDGKKAAVALIRIGDEEIGFRVLDTVVIPGSSPPRTRCFLLPHDFNPEFVAGDGSSSNAHSIRYLYSPRFRSKLVNDGVTELVPGGYGASSTVDVKVLSQPVRIPRGVSPELRRGGERYFAGRTMLFTHHPLLHVPGISPPVLSAEAADTVAHELVHAFGLPHKCGYFDHRTPRDRACYMNYEEPWLMREDRTLIPGTAGRNGPSLCGRHIKEIRSTHLEDNAALDWSAPEKQS